MYNQRSIENAEEEMLQHPASARLPDNCHMSADLVSPYSKWEVIKKELWYLIHKKEVIFCIIGGLTLVSGLILLIIGLSFVRNTCRHCTGCANYKEPSLLPQIPLMLPKSRTATTRITPTSPLVIHSNQSSVTYFPNFDPAYPTRKLNLALNKPTSQSSTFHWGTHALNSSLAVDGNQDARLSSGSCSQTNREWRPYSYVDLEKSETIKEVKLVAPCCSRDTDIFNFEVRVSNTPTFDDSIVCKHFMGAARKIAFSVPCDTTSVYGRYLRIQLLGDESDSTVTTQLTLCEVIIYGL